MLVVNLLKYATESSEWMLWTVVEQVIVSGTVEAVEAVEQGIVSGTVEAVDYKTRKQQQKDDLVARHVHGQ